MASKKFIVDIDLTQQHLLNAALQVLATAPSSPVEGQIYWNSAVDTAYCWTGTAWLDLGQVYTHPTFPGTGQPGTALAGANVISQITVYNGHVTGVVTRAMTPADIGASAATHTHAFGQITGLPTQTILGNNTGTTGPALALTVSDLLTMLSIGYGSLALLTAGTDTTSRTYTPKDIADYVTSRLGTYLTVVNLALGTRTATTLPITNSAGTGFTLPVATTTLAGLMSAADKVKLDGIATGANNYIHPTVNPGAHPFANAITSGLLVLSQMVVNNEGHVVSIAGRNLTAADMAAVLFNDAINNGTVQTWTSTKIYTEIQNAIGQAQTGALQYKGNYNAATNTPSITTDTTIKTGWLYVVSVAGTFLGEVVEPGDMIIAKQDNPGATLANWQTVNKNIPAIVDATTLVKGIVRLSTTAEAIAGTDNTTAMTPLAVKAVLDAKTGGYYAAFGNGSATTFTITHSLGTDRIQVQVRAIATKEEIILDWRATSSTVVTCNMNVAPATNSYEILIDKIGGQ